MFYNLKSAVLVLGTIIAASNATPFAKADEWDKKTVITTHEPIRIEGKVLEPGQYIIKLFNSADRHIVQIYDLDNSKLEMTVQAIPAYRLDTTADTRLTFSETPDGQAPALRTWFYPGDNSGLEFSAMR